MNDFISLVKSTSLASSITIIEMTMVGQQFASVTLRTTDSVYGSGCDLPPYQYRVDLDPGQIETGTSKYLKKA